VDNHGVFVYVNPARAALQGYVPEEMIGQPAVMFLEPSEQANFISLTKWVNSGNPIHTIRRLRHRNGQPLEVQLVARAWFEDNQVAGVVSVIHDITTTQPSDSSFLTSPVAQNKPLQGLLVLPNIAAALHFMQGVGGTQHFQACLEPSPSGQPTLTLHGRALTIQVQTGSLEDYQRAIL
jgi:PAS domain S-box-containing protein